MSTIDKDNARLTLALAKAGHSLVELGRKVPRGDFLTRRLHDMAVRELARTLCDDVCLEDLDRAYLDTPVEAEGDLTDEQVSCRYMAEVMRRTRQNGRQRRTAQRSVLRPRALSLVGGAA